MKSRPGVRHAVFAGAILSILAAAGCSDSGGQLTPDATNGGGGDAINYQQLSGSVRSDGSSTVFPISEAVAEEFSKAAPGVKANVAFSGTGGGFEKFCRGEIEVSNASRPITEKEKAACAANGITDIVEAQVAIDALTVAVNPANTWATCMTPAELQLAFKAGGASRWSDINPAWPDRQIRFVTPGADSGTFDYFKEAIKLRGAEKDEPAHRADVTASEDDNILVKAVEGDRDAIGYFGFAYFTEAGKDLTAVAVDNGQGCVAPTYDNALTGKYAPLSRPLLIYTRESLLRDRPEVLGFVKFYMDHAAELAPEVGYVSLPDNVLAAQQAKVDAFLAGRG